MILEDRGVRKESFISLQEQAKSLIYTSTDSIENFVSLLRTHGMGFGYHLPFILEQLVKLGLDFKETSRDGSKAIENAFLGRVLRFAMNGCLRDIKHKAQIPVPGSYKLVGCADEGLAYIREGLDKDSVYTLPAGCIFGMSLHFTYELDASLTDICKACVQEGPDSETKFLKGPCMISRSPVVHPGDSKPPILSVFLS